MDFVRSPSAGAIVYFGGTTRDTFAVPKRPQQKRQNWVPVGTGGDHDAAENSKTNWPLNNNNNNNSNDKDNGNVKGIDNDNENDFEIKKVLRLEYQAYVPMALRTLERVAQKALRHHCNQSQSETQSHEDDNNNDNDVPPPPQPDQKSLPCDWGNPICKVYIAHRLGHVPVCEESVVIAVSTSHRKEGWMAAEWILEEVKRTAEIWKNEVYEDGSAMWKANDGTKPAGFSGSY